MAADNSGKLAVFISYSRNDLKFADQLDVALGIQFATTIDRHGISGGEDWKRRLGNLIRDADTVVFVLSPASATSDICHWEVEEAVRLGKRILPVLCRPLDGTSAPPQLHNLNYIFFYEEAKSPGSGFGNGLAQLVAALNNDLDWLREHTRLLQRASEWQTGGRPSNRLLSGEDIRLAKAWAARRPKEAPAPTALHLDFIKASEDWETHQQSEERQRLQERERLVHDREIAQVDKEAAQKREAEASRRVVRRTLLGLAAAVVLAVAAILAGVYAYIQRGEALAEKSEAELRLLTSDVEMKSQQSLLLNVRLTSLSKDARDLRQQLRTTGGLPLHGHEMATRTAAFSPDRRWLATGSEEGAVRLWDLSHVKPTSALIAGHKGPVHGLAVSSDSRWLVSGAADGAVRLWRLTAEGAKPHGVFAEGRYGAIQSLALSPNGGWLVLGTQKGNVCIWKMSVDGLQEEPCDAWKDDVPVMQVLFSAKGRWLATSCTGACKSYDAPVRLWDLSGDFPRQDPRLLSHATALVEASLLAIAFSEDETRLAVAYGYVAEVWDLTQENPPQHVLGPYSSSGGWIRTLGLSPDNHWLAMGSSGSAVLLWDLTGSRKEPIPLKGHGAAVNSVVFSDDGRWLATGSADATARL